MKGEGHPQFTARSHIFVIGDLVLDLVVSAPEGLRYGTDAPGVISPRPGGSAANFATWCTRLGVPTIYAGRVGADPLGRALSDDLREEGVDFRGSLDPEAPSGVILALVDQNGERSMVISPGANHRFDESDVPEDAVAGAALVHLTGYSFFWEAPRRAARRVLDIARSAGVPISVDPSSVELLRRFGPRTFLEEVHGARFFLPNLEEGRLLTGVSDPEEVVNALVHPFPVVGLKLGAEGCLCAIRPPGGGAPLVVRAPAEGLGRTGAIDTTGAGDAWDAAFAVEYLRCGDMQKAASLANRVAAWVVARPGSRPKGWVRPDSTSA